MCKPLIVLAGPTAVGKTELSLKLAEKLNGSIISADSMQVYRHMDIGSAKIPYEERRGIPHYLIDVLEPDQDFNVYTFKKMSDEAMREIWTEGRVPILTGGTGFYIQAVLRDIDFTEDDGKSDIREALGKLEKENGPEYLHQILERIDPDAAASIHPNNVKRVIRAIEYQKLTGERISVHNAREQEKKSPYCSLYFVLNEDRRLLYDNIDKRVDQMMSAGLVNEVKGLLDHGVPDTATSMKGLGYSELIPYVRGECSLDEAVEKIKTDTRHFAKRQLTWFRRESDVIWINKEDFDFDEDAILNYMIMLWKARQRTYEEEQHE